MFTEGEKKVLLDIVWTAIANGNRVEGKPFDPTPEQYKLLCSIVKKLDK